MPDTSPTSFKNPQQTLRAWFSEMLVTAKTDFDWFVPWRDEYKDFCLRIKRSDHLSDEDFEKHIFKLINDISNAGNSILSKELFKAMSTDRRFLNALQAFKRTPDIDHYNRFENAWHNIAKQKGKYHRPLRVNRVAVAFTNSVVNVPNEDHFYPLLDWMKDCGFVSFEPKRHWFEDSQSLARSLTKSLSSVPGYDVWWRNVFPWWLIEKKKDTKPQDASSSTNTNSLPMKQSLNTILYGPPGTGKTYNTADYAVAIIEGKSVEDIQQENHDEVHKRFLGYKEQKRIAFTTFHQSYGYEDFIEGIRPVLDEDGASIGYELHEGLFKEFCTRARKPAMESVSSFGLNDNPVVWKVSLEGTGENETRKDCLKNGYIRIGWDEYGEAISSETFKDSSEGRTILNAFINGMSVGDIVLSCWSATEIDAIGVVTGEYEWDNRFEYYRRLRKVRWLVKGIRENILSLNGGKKLTLSTVYRLGRVQVADVLALASKHLGRSIASPENAPPVPYVFVIDEINRGNISKIFGELITLVEPSKRLGSAEETKAKLPYSGDDFGVPSNVYILGTMNTADRSIALLDTALRRRFEFVEMMPNPDLLADIHVGDTGIDLKAMLQRMNDRIEFLLDREHTIGHAYFLGDFKDHPTLAGLAEIFRNKIVPLLQEYFFDDYSKIRLVLGDNGKKEIAVQFFNEKKPDDVFFGNAEDAVDPDRCVYRINEKAFDNPAAYIGIYDKGTTA